MNAHITATTDAHFEHDVLKSELPVLVDFWAEWCGPCKMLSPILDTVAQSYAGKVKIVKLNVEENPATSTQFAVRAIPTLLLFKHGSVVGNKTGLLSQAQLTAFIDEHL